MPPNACAARILRDEDFRQIRRLEAEQVGRTFSPWQQELGYLTAAREAPRLIPIDPPEMRDTAFGQHAMHAYL